MRIEEIVTLCARTKIQNKFSTGLTLLEIEGPR